MQAAIPLFAELGFKGTSTRKICELASANISSIPYYFRNKEGLYDEVVSLIASTLRARLNPYIEISSNVHVISSYEAKKQLCCVIEVFIDSVLSSDIPDSFRLIIVREQLRPSAAFEILYKNIFKDFYGLLCSLIASSTKNSPDDHRVIFCANTIIGQVLSFKIFAQTTYRFIGVKSYDDQHIKTIKELVTTQIKAILDTTGGEE